MKKNLIICDRCKRPCDEEGSGRIRAFGVHITGGTETVPNIFYDLCSWCMGEFDVDFMKLKPPLAQCEPTKLEKMKI